MDSWYRSERIIYELRQEGYNYEELSRRSLGAIGYKISPTTCKKHINKYKRHLERLEKYWFANLGTFERNHLLNFYRVENEDELQQVPLATVKRDFEGSPKQYNMGENTIRCVLRAVTKAMEMRDDDHR
jgi:hypothetical protein